jgi:GWxTD domain-containing protein
MKRTMGPVAGILLWALTRAVAAQPVRDSEDWADSPEAYFLTAEERAQWKVLDSRDSRGFFEQRYWLKRDPTPGTEKNEFKDLILGRIKTADQHFGIEKTPGSRTARGFVFVVFGSPARVRDTHAPPPEAPRFPAATTGPLEGNETLALWIYDRERTPRILEALDRPSLEIEIMIEPSRHSDSIQKPGLVKELREKLAKKTIVNPDLIPSGPVEAAPAAPVPAALPRAALDPAQHQLLEQAPFASRSGDSVFGDAVLWRDGGPPETLVWFALPPSPAAARRFLHGVVRKQNGGEEIASVSEPAAASAAFSTAVAGEVVLRRLALPPGDYEVAFAVTEGAARPVASAAARLTVPDLGSGFVVSPLILSLGPGGRSPGDDAVPFAIGRVVLPPRADATFSASESLWFFLEMANAADPSKVTLELRVRKGADAVSSRPAFPAQLETFAGGRSLCGFELPLEGLPAGDYRLYVLVRDGVAPADQPVVRSADFRLQP